jgi:hypothetical protein
MENRRKFQIAIGVTAAGILLWGYVKWRQPDNYVNLEMGGKASFYQGNVFSHRRFGLEYWRGQWHISGAAEILAVPFECPYNETRTLRLEADGRVWVIVNTESSRYELRDVNGEWSYDAGDQWVSIFFDYE